MLDLRSIVVSGVLLDVICTLVVVVLWRQNRHRFEGLFFWTADYLLQTAGLLLIVLRGAVPDWMSVILANACVIAGALLGLLGLERFIGIKGRHSHNVLLFALFLAVHCTLVWGYPSLYLRSANIALALLLVCAQCAWLALRRAGAAMRPITRLMGVVFMSYSLLFAGRIALLLSSRETDSDYFHSGLAEAAFMLSTQMLFVLHTYALILMVNQRLAQNIRQQEEKYSKAFRSVPCAVSLTRLSDGTLIEANDWLRRKLGFTHEALIGKTTLELDLWANPADRARLTEKLKTCGGLFEEEVLLRDKAGQEWIGLLSAGIIALNGEECVLASMSDITDRRRSEAERERLISEREKALSEVRIMSGLLPICAACKKIRDEKGLWQQMEHYVHTHSHAQFSHGLCPDCEHTLYPDPESAASLSRA